MALLELIGRLGLNTGPFEAGLRRAKIIARSESSEIAHVFAHVGLGLLGIHGLGRTLQHIITETISWSKDIEKAREEFERLGLSIDESVLRSLRESGIELERLKFGLGAVVAPVLGKAGSIFSMAGSTIARGLNYALHPFDPNRNLQLDEEIRKRAIAIENPIGPEEEKKFREREEKIGKLRERLNEIREKNALAEMSDEQKLAALIDRRLNILETISGTLPREERFNREILAETILGEIQGLQRKTSTAKAFPMGRESFDSLARIGGFAQTQQNFPQRVEQLVFYTQATAKHAEEIAKGIEGFKHYVNRAGFWKEVDW